MERSLLNEACKVAYLAAQGNKGSSRQATQVNQLLEVFESQVKEDAINELLVHVMYQTSRLHINREASREIIGVVENIRSKSIEDNEKYSQVRSFLLHVKKLHKIFVTFPKLSEDRANQDFDTLVKNFKNFQGDKQ